MEPSVDRIRFLMRDHDLVFSPDHRYTSGTFVFPRFMFTGVGLNSNIVDMTKWQLALLSGRVMKPETLDEAAKPFKLNDGKSGEWGLGWDVGSRNGHRCTDR